MSIVYRSSLLFSQPSYYTISHMQVQQALYHHKKKLSINQRSTSKDNNYKTQRLSARQARTIENLSQYSKNYSLNTLLKTYNSKFQIDQKNPFQTINSFQHKHNGKGMFETINSNRVSEKNLICPEKLKLFKAGVNYRSNQRARGVGIKKVNLQDLKDYFDRCPEQQIDFHQVKRQQTNKRNSSIQRALSQRKTCSSFKFNRLPSQRLSVS